jgi:amino-acid N-acetyltransferase
VGFALVTNRLQLARANGLEIVYLLTTTAPDFFRRIGFSPAERSSAPLKIAMSPEFAHACPASAACLKFDLSLPVGTSRR